MTIGVGDWIGLREGTGVGLSSPSGVGDGDSLGRGVGDALGDGLGVDKFAFTFVFELMLFVLKSKLAFAPRLVFVFIS